MSTRPAARVRHNFSKLEKVLEVPNLIDIQRSSFEWFINEGLRETIDDISPIEDFTGTLAVQFGKYTLGGWEPGMPFDHIQPNDSIKDCREKDITYAAPLTMEVAFINRETGEIREQKVFMGDLPLMTEWGTYIINGTERVVVTQLVRSPGAYVMEPKDREKQVFIANLMPSRGSWVELEIDKKGLVHVRIDRKRKLPVTTLLFALGYTRDDVANLFRHPDDPDRVNPFIQATLDKDATEGNPQTGDRNSLKEVYAIADEIHALAKGLDDKGAEERAARRGRDREAREEARRPVGRHHAARPDRGLQEAAPGRAAHGRQLARPRALAVLRPQALRPHQGRPLQAGRAPRAEPRLERPHAHQPALHRARLGQHRRPGRADPAPGGPADQDRAPRGVEGLRRRLGGDPARRDRGRPRRVRALREPPPADRRRADPGGLPHRPLPDGARRPRADEHRGRGHDHASDDHQHPARGGGAEGVLRLLAAVAVHGPDQLAGRAHAPAASVGPRRRRAHP